MIQIGAATDRHADVDAGGIEIGVITFAEMFPVGDAGSAPTAGERLQQVLREAQAAETAGLAVYGVGEHHRPDFAVSAPAVVLAAIGECTSTIRLTSAATVLGCADPVRVYQDFATIDLLTGGRAEIIAGSGSFAETPPLFGLSAQESREGYAENLRLLTQVRDHELVTWAAGRRPAIDGLGIYPRPESPLPIWAAASNDPSSASLAGELGLPLVLGWFGQPHSTLRDLAQAHRGASDQAGHRQPRLALQTHGYLARSTEQAADEYFPAYAATIARLKSGAKLTREQFDRMCSVGGHLLIGTSADVADKIQLLHIELGIDRVLVHVSAGAMPHARVLDAIDLLGEVQALLGQVVTGAQACRHARASNHSQVPAE